jgi:hypothetical protein
MTSPFCLSVCICQSLCVSTAIVVGNWQLAVCVSVCPPHQFAFVFYAARVVSEENGLLFLPRISFYYISVLIDYFVSTFYLGPPPSVTLLSTVNSYLLYPIDYTVTCMSDYRRGLDWWIDLLTTYTFTTRDYTLQITDTHKPVYQSITVSTSRVLATDFNTGSIHTRPRSLVFFLVFSVN